MARYYLKGALKVEGGRIYERYDGKYVLDFYRDNAEFCTPENECGEEEALKEFVRIYETENGFKDE